MTFTAVASTYLARRLPKPSRTPVPGDCISGTGILPGLSRWGSGYGKQIRPSHRTTSSIHAVPPLSVQVMSSRPDVTSTAGMNVDVTCVQSVVPVTADPLFRLNVGARLTHRQFRPAPVTLLVLTQYENVWRTPGERTGDWLR